jgi:hypothetical protein
MDGPGYSLLLGIAVMAAFAYALSAEGRRWRRGFSEKPLGWLSALERKTTIGRWTVLAVGLCILAGLQFITGPKRYPDHLLLLVVVGITGGIGNLLWELSTYASTEIEVRKRLK